MSAPPSATAIESDVVTFSLLGQPVAVRSKEPQVFAAYRRLYRHFPEIPPTPEAHLVEIIEHANDESGHWEALVEYLPSHRHATLGQALHRAEVRLCSHALLHSTDVIGLHTSTIAFGDELALVTGDSGSGKTTLTLSLSARGFPVDGDDIAVLDPLTGLVRGMPRCFHLDSASIEMLAEQGLDVDSKQVCEGFLTPGDVGDGHMLPRRVRAIFFLTPDNLAEPIATPIAHSEAAAKLDGQTGPRHLPSLELFAAFSTMLRDARCFELRRGPLGTTADLVIGTMKRLQEGAPL